VLQLLSGCATITKGRAQTVTIDTFPPGANCTLTREGEALAVVNPTPNTISVAKSKDPIAVVCKKEGYIDSTGVVESKFQDMTVGNVLFGGLIGVAVDASSGAMNEYPPMVTITLIPEKFETVEHRDAFFEKMKADFLTQSAKALKEISDKCVDEDDCQSKIKAAEALQEAKLSEIESKRQLAKVDTTSVNVKEGMKDEKADCVTC